MEFGIEKCVILMMYEEERNNTERNRTTKLGMHLCICVLKEKENYKYLGKGHHEINRNERKSKKRVSQKKK